MSPVKQTAPRSARSLLIGVGGLVAGIVLVLGLFVLAIPSLTEQGQVEVHLGDAHFVVGDVERRATSVAEDGPFLFQDVADGQRDIYVQHLGGDPEEGWYAFDARQPEQPRDCWLRWVPEDGHFEDSCDGTVVPPDGEGLRQYGVEVTEDGQLVVELHDLAGADDGSETDDGRD